MKYIWAPLCFALAAREYNSYFCGDMGSMWLMWFVMALMHIESYIEIIKGKK